MEFINCENCQCWNQNHWVFDKNINKNPPSNQTEGNVKFGVCQRHAPFVASQGSHPNSNYFLLAFRKVLPTNLSLISLKNCSYTDQ